MISTWYIQVLRMLLPENKRTYMVINNLEKLMKQEIDFYFGELVTPRILLSFLTVIHWPHNQI